MKIIYTRLLCRKNMLSLFTVLAWLAQQNHASAQNCPSSIPSIILSNPDTYYPGLDASLSPGAKNITLGASGSGSTTINTGDLLLLIQMQGAQISAANSAFYGDSTGTGTGYLKNTNMLAGNVEYVVAANTVSLSGGVLNLQNPITKNYRNADYSTDGQYRYQVIRVGVYYDLTLGATITAPAWNGKTGGVVVLTVTTNLNLNGQLITASGSGFRGGAARQLNGGSGGLNTDFVSLSTKNFHGSKGEGIAGTPRYINNNGIILDNGAALEGYPNGSYANGAPGNAGGGGTDGRPSNNDHNSGGGGGGNISAGGFGGNSYSSNVASGGKPGAAYTDKTPSRFVMGGGGGAGTTNNGTGLLAGLSSSGSAGGGIVIITAASITGTGTVNVSGTSGNITVLNDGNGGGGAAGTVLIYAGSGQSNITVNANGGAGGSNTGTGHSHGPGGGGSGGLVYSNGPINAASTYAGGAAGFTVTPTNHYGATDGAAGTMVNTVTLSQVPPQTLYCSLLPVYFLELTAVKNYAGILLNWSASNEANTNNYSIEKSSNGSSFVSIGTVSTVGNEINHYNFTDLAPGNTAVLYYRIKALSANASPVYSKTIAARIETASASQLSVWPNPVNSKATASFTATGNNTAYLQVLDLTGKKIQDLHYQATAGTNNVSLNLQNIPNGTYLLQCISGSSREISKLIIAH